MTTDSSIVRAVPCFDRIIFQGGDTKIILGREAHQGTTWYSTSYICSLKYSTRPCAKGIGSCSTTSENRSGTSNGEAYAMAGKWRIFRANSSF